MLLSVISPRDFVEFLRITAWIALPVLAIVIILAVLQHYWRIKKLRLKGIPAAEAGDHLPPDTHVFFDHSGLLNKYRKRMSYYQARYHALRTDFEKLQQDQQQKTTILNHLDMENAQQHQFSGNVPGTEQNLEQFNEAGRETGASEQSINTIDTGDAATEISCIRVLLQDRTAQIGFLQDQLEQRVRGFYQQEKEWQQVQQQLLDEKKELLSAMEGVAAEHAGQLAEAEEQLQQQILVAEEEARLSAVRHDQVIFLENQLREIQQQNQILDAALEDERDRAAALRNEIEEISLKSVALEQQLQNRRQRLQGMYRHLQELVEQEDAITETVERDQPDNPGAYKNMIAL